jgi:hypothetical protein
MHLFCDDILLNCSKAVEMEKARGGKKEERRKKRHSIWRTKKKRRLLLPALGEVLATGAGG